MKNCTDTFWFSQVCHKKRTRELSAKTEEETNHVKSPWAVNGYKGMRSAKCATPRDTMQNSRDQVTVYLANPFVSSDPGWKVFMSCRTKEPFSSGSVPCALTIIFLILCHFHSSTPRTALCPALRPVPAFPIHAPRASVFQPCSVPQCSPLPSH